MSHRGTLVSGVEVMREDSHGGTYSTDDVVAAFEQARVFADAAASVQSDVEYRAIRYLRTDGQSVRDIAARLRIPKSTVARTIARSMPGLMPGLWETPEAHVRAHNAVWAQHPEEQTANALLTREVTDDESLVTQMRPDS